MKHASTNLFSTLLVFMRLLIRYLILYLLNHAPKRLVRKLNKILIKEKINYQHACKNNSKNSN